MLDVNLQLTLDATILNHRYTQQHWESIIYSLEDTKLFQELYPGITGEAVVEFVSFERKNPNSIYSCFCAARENARSVRELISAEMFELMMTDMVSSLILSVTSVSQPDPVGIRCRIAPAGA